MTLFHTLATEAPVARLQLEGRLDGPSVPALQEFTERRREAGIRDAGLLLDLSALAFCDSLGVGALVALSSAEAQAGREMVVCGLRPAVRRVLEAVRLHEVFTIFDDADAALRWLAPAQVPPIAQVEAA